MPGLLFATLQTHFLRYKVTHHHHEGGRSQGHSEVTTRASLGAAERKEMLDSMLEASKSFKMGSFKKPSLSRGTSGVSPGGSVVSRESGQSISFNVSMHSWPPHALHNRSAPSLPPPSSTLGGLLLWSGRVDTRETDRKLRLMHPVLCYNRYVTNAGPCPPAASI